MTVHFIGAGPGAADLITVRHETAGLMPGVSLRGLDHAEGNAGLVRT
jgi:hypothetical protein